MKYVAAALLALNVVFFLWARDRIEPLPTELPSADPGVPALRLLDEKTLAAAHAAEAEAKEGGSSLVPGCYAVGPLPTGKSATDAAAGFATAGVRVRTRPVAPGDPGGFRLYLPPLPSAEAALDAVSQLTEEGFRASANLTAGPQQNGVELGVFPDRPSAEAHRKVLGSLGRTARIQPRKAAVEEYWVEYNQTADQTVAAPEWKRIATTVPDLHNLEPVPMNCQGW